MSEASDIQTLGNVSRPPGHHAQDALCGGYCYFNNAAIAARYLLEYRDSGALAILDIDYHHGNGSRWPMFGLESRFDRRGFVAAQQIFYEDPRVLYVSLHADGDYPCKYSCC